MATCQVLLLSSLDVQNTGVTYAHIISALEEVFGAHARGLVRMAQKTSLRFPEKDGAFLNSLPAYLPATGLAGVKWVSGFVEARRRGLPYIMGVIILNDADTGAPVCIMDGTLVTEMRTAAVSAVAAKRLMRRGVSALGVVGCGAQGEAHFRAMSQIARFSEGYCFDVVHDRSRDLARRMTGELGFPVHASETAEGVLDRADVAASCTVPSAPFLDHRWVREGSVVVSIEGRQSWLAPSYRSFDKVCVDEWHSLKEGAHLKDVLTQGYFGAGDVHAELSDLVSGTKSGRSDDREKILVLTRGLGMEDVAVASLVYRLAREKGIGTPFGLF